MTETPTDAEPGSMIRALERQIEASEGQRFIVELNRLGTSLRVFKGNHDELRRALDTFRQPKVAIQLMSESERGKLDLFLVEVIRLLHNFVAGARSFAEVTRSHARRLYKGTAFFEEYEERVKHDFEDSPLSCFVQDLRVFVLHVDVPWTVARVSWKRDENLRSSVRLNVGHLRQWGNWKPKSRQFIAALADDVDLSDIVAEYSKLVADFHEWFLQRQMEVQADVIRQRDDLCERLEMAEKARGSRRT